MRLTRAAACAACLIAAGVLGAASTEGRRWWSHILALANDGMEGRNTGSEGYRKAVAYVVGEFRKAGLKPAGADGFLQPVRFNVRRLVEEGSSLELVRDGRAQKIKLGGEAMIGIRTDPAEYVEAPLYFAGYGFAVPEKNYNDLADPALRGKIMVALAGAPERIPGPLRAHFQSVSERAPFFKQAGVVGTVGIPNPKHMDIPWSRMALSAGQPAMALADPALDVTDGSRIGVIYNPERAAALFEGSGHTLDELLALADAGKPLPHFPLTASLRARTKVERSAVESPNVAGMLEGSDAELRNEYVVVSAHLDHVGVGQPIDGDRIYNGAMDDASGVASLLEMARLLHTAKPRPRRSVLFLAVTAEEKGLLGSKYFAAHPTVSARSLVADINLDMFLPLFPLHSLTVYGLNESDLGDLMREAARPLGIRVDDDPEPDRNLFVRSDQYSFIRRGIPALSMKVGYDKGSPEEQVAKAWLTKRYHAPSDDLDQPVDLDSAAAFNRLVLELVRTVASRPERPHWKADSFFRRFAD